MMTAHETMVTLTGMSARCWMHRGREHIRLVFGNDLTTDQEIALVAAYMNAAAMDQHGMYMRELVEAVGDLREMISTKL